jgi:O-succinylbenzoate synthase
LRVERAEAIAVKMPLKFPFETSYGRQSERETVLVRLFSGGVSGWGEAAVSEYPDYCCETPSVALLVLEKYFFPLVVGKDFDDPAHMLFSLERINGYPFSRTGLETAFIDLYCRAAGIPVHKWLGGSRAVIAPGISLGIEDDQAVLFERIEWAMEMGYKRIKLKIKPGRDVSVVAAVRERFGGFPLMVDANSAYTLDHLDRLRDLDRFHLMMIEQPLGHDDLSDHARLQKSIRTHVCLDESIQSMSDLRAAVALGSCRVVNVKYGRVGGLIKARAIAGESVENGIAVWCGGMLESGVGRAHNLALNSLAAFSLPGDISASDRYWDQDIIDPPVVMEDGVIELSDKPGMGYEVIEERVKKLITAKVESGG